MSLERARARGARLLAALAAAMVLAAAAPAPAEEDPAPMSREEFELRKERIAADAVDRSAGAMLRRLGIYERDAEYVDEEVRKRTEAGETGEQALAGVAGVGRADRIAKARRRLLEVHMPTEADRRRVLANFRAVEGDMAGAGIAAGSVRAAIPLIESTYNPMAFNIAERLGGETVKGMWQFTESTGRGYGLAVTRRGAADAAGDTDERYDPARSSAAARAYLDDLDAFEFANGCPAGDELILASYHMGQGNVNRKIRKYGCDFWAWRKDGEHGFGTHSYNYPALVLAGSGLMAELGAGR